MRSTWLDQPSRWSFIRAIKYSQRKFTSVTSAKRRSVVRGVTEDHVLILPGFLTGWEPYEELVDNLQPLGISSEILKVGQSDWYPTLLGGSFEWYVEQLCSKIDALYEQYERLILIGHSAGGWIARICLGQYPYMGRECDRGNKVKALLTLGTPHLSLEDYPLGRFKESVYSVDKNDLEGRSWDSSLKFTNDLYGEAAALASTSIVTIIGSGFLGAELKWTDRIGYLLKNGRISQEVSVAAYAFTSYLANCGNGNAVGDGVCPVETSLLPGAQHVVIPDVYHGPNSYGLNWYGSKDAIAKWKTYIENPDRSGEQT